MIWERYNYTTHISEDDYEVEPGDRDEMTGSDLPENIAALEALVLDSDDMDAGNWNEGEFNMKNERGELICIRPKN